MPTETVPKVTREPLTEQERFRRRVMKLEFDEQELVQQILSWVTQDEQDRQEWLVNRKRDLDQYHNVVVPKDFPWPDCANFHPPITMIGVETLKPRLVAAMTSQKPYVWVRGRGAEDQVKADTVQDYLNWQLDVELKFPELVDELAHHFLVNGTVAAIPTWRRETRLIRQIREFQPTDTLDEIFSVLFKGLKVSDVLQEDSVRYRVTFLDQDRTKEAQVEFLFLEEATLAYLEYEAVIADQPSVDIPEIEDVLIPARAKDLERSSRVIRRLWLSENDLRRRARKGLYNPRVVEQLLQSGEDFPSSNAEQESLKEERDELEGIQPTELPQPYLVYEVYCRWDINGDDLEEEIIAWVSDKVRDKALRIDLLDNVFLHGHRPIVAGRFMPTNGRFYGISFPTMVRDIQEEIAAMHNQRVDFGTLQNLPFFIYRANSTFKPDLYRLRPGDGIPAENPAQDFVFPRFQGTPAFGQTEEAMQYQYFERLTGITDLTLGRTPARVGATRTATGTVSLLGESNARFDLILRRFRQFVLEIVQHVLWLDQQHLPPGKEFRVTGKKEVIRIKDRSELLGQFDIELSATSEVVNKAIVRETAAILLQTMANPALIQLGILDVTDIATIVEQYLKAFDVKGIQVKRPAQQMPPILPPEQEWSMLASGQDAPPSPLDDLEAHLQRDIEFAASEQFGFFPTDQVDRFRQHLLEVQRLLLMQQQSMLLGSLGGQQGGQGSNRMTQTAGRLGIPAFQAQMPAMQRGAEDGGEIGQGSMEMGV